MTEDSSLRPRFEVVGTSVRGSSHLKNGIENQDAVSWAPLMGGVPPVAVAVSDGHGSRPHYRSREGARLAVEVAIEAALHFAGAHGGDAPDEVSARAGDELAAAIETAWKEQLDAQLLQDPPAGAETLAGDDRYRPYGATLLLSLVTEAWILFLQIGDGDIVIIDDDVGSMRTPIPPDPRLSGGATTSLCMPNAWREARVVCERLSRPPSLIVLTTDGLSNSYSSNDALFQVIQSYHERIEEFGLAQVSAAFGDWHRHTSAMGSGDDITLGVIHRISTGSVPRPESTLSREPPSPELIGTGRREGRAPSMRGSRLVIALASLAIIIAAAIALTSWSGIGPKLRDGVSPDAGGEADQAGTADPAQEPF